MFSALSPRFQRIPIQRVGWSALTTQAKGKSTTNSVVRDGFDKVSYYAPVNRLICSQKVCSAKDNDTEEIDDSYDIVRSKPSIPSARELNIL